MKNLFKFILFVMISYLILNFIDYYRGKTAPIGLVYGVGFSDEYFIPEKIVIYEKNQQIGELIMDDAGNNIKSKGEIPKGKMKFYYEYKPLKRNLFMEAEVKEKYLDGEAKAYYADGQVWIETNYQKGQLDGLTKEYYRKSGRVKREIDYNQGRIDGSVKKYYDRGTMESDSSYLKSKLHGVSKVFYEKGNVKEEMSYIKEIIAQKKLYLKNI